MPFSNTITVIWLLIVNIYWMLKNMPELGLSLSSTIPFIKFSVPPFHYLAAAHLLLLARETQCSREEKNHSTPQPLYSSDFHPFSISCAWLSPGTTSSLKAYPPALDTMTTCFYSSHPFVYAIQPALGLLFNISSSIFFPPTISSPDFTSFPLSLDPVTSFQVPPPTALTISLSLPSCHACPVKCSTI